MKSFASRYEGTCKICMTKFTKGTLIVWNRAVKGQVAHETCYANNGSKFNTAEPVVHENLQEDIQEDIRPTTATTTTPNDLASVIAASVAPFVKIQKDEIVNTVLEVLETFDLGSKTVTQRIEIANLITGETKDMGQQHKLFPTLLKMMQARDHKGNRLNIWITGPAGTGKTTGGEKCAEALSLQFASTGAIVESYKIFGFMSPGTSQYVSTPFRNIWENGGVFIFDDFDGSDPTCAVELNNALANGYCTFPDTIVKRHADCVLILTANTWGHGGTEDYVGRLKQDKAFIDRFAKLHWDIDEDLELATCPDTQWTKEVQRLRKNAAKKGLKVLITPRASYTGAALLAAGIERSELVNHTIKPQLSSDQWSAIC